MDDGDGCMKCGDQPASNYVEIEAPIGDVGMPGQIAGSLCNDCAGSLLTNAVCHDNVPIEKHVDADPDLTMADVQEGFE